MKIKMLFVGAAALTTMTLCGCKPADSATEAPAPQTQTPAANQATGAPAKNAANPPVANTNHPAQPGPQ